MDDHASLFDNAKRLLTELDGLRHTVASSQKSVVNAQHLADAQLRDLDAKSEEFRTALRHLTAEFNHFFPVGTPLVPPVSRR